MLEFSPVLLSAETAQAAPKVLKALSHEALFLLLLQICLLLAVARGLGEWMRKINQPPVVGELIAGVLLGPSVLGLLLPQLQAEIFPKVQAQADLLSVVSWVGVLFLLIVTGLETDLNLIVRKGKSALMISLGGIVVPFATGFGLGELLPDAFLANPEQRLIFSLFMAVAMSISAVPVIAKVLMDLKLIRRDIGRSDDGRYHRLDFALCCSGFGNQWQCRSSLGRTLCRRSGAFPSPCFYGRADRSRSDHRPCG
jgi:hypothetical protein